MSVKGQSAAERQACDQQQRVMDDFEAELLADLEEDAYGQEQFPCKRHKNEAPRTPDVSEATWNRQTGLLGQLPAEVVLRMFGFLSAEDLAVSAQACRYLAFVSSQDELWKRLYCASAEPPCSLVRAVLHLILLAEGLPGRLLGWSDANTKPSLTSSWKTAYISKDGIEISEVLSGVPEGLQPLYKEMAVSKRSLSLGRGYVSQGAQAVASRNRHSPVAQWRVENGLPEAPDADHVCPGRCSFINIVDNVYICEHCGREHMCDESCKERVLDTANGMPVCPISGMCFDQLDVEWEEDSDGGKPDDTLEWGDEGVSLAGRLGQAYTAGYNCNTEEELQQVCGLQMFRP